VKPLTTCILKYSKGQRKKKKKNATGSKKNHFINKDKLNLGWF